MFLYFIEIKRVTLCCDFQVFVQILGPGANLIFKLCSYILRLKWCLNFFSSSYLVINMVPKARKRWFWSPLIRDWRPKLGPGTLKPTEKWTYIFETDYFSIFDNVPIISSAVVHIEQTCASIYSKYQIKLFQILYLQKLLLDTKFS